MTAVQWGGLVLLAWVAAGFPVWCLCVAAGRHRPSPPGTAAVPPAREELQELPLLDAITAQRGWQLVDEIEEWLSKGEHA